MTTILNPEDKSQTTMNSNKQQKNFLLLKKDYGIYYGRLFDNSEHKHYAIQISVSTKNLKIHFHKQQKTSNGFIIKSNVPHYLSSDDKQLLILINPISSIGHYLTSSIKKDIEDNHFILTDIKKIILQFIEKESKSFLTNELESYFSRCKCTCEDNIHIKDERIHKVLKFMNDNSHRVIPASEMANYCSLSTSRFLHLFNENMNFSFRRAQIWNKVKSSLHKLEDQNICDTAIDSGFVDNAHFSKSFKECFGYSPSFFLRLIKES